MCWNYVLKLVVCNHILFNKIVIDSIILKLINKDPKAIIE